MADLSARIVLSAVLSGRYRSTFRQADAQAKSLFDRLHRLGVPRALETDTRRVGAAMDRLHRSQGDAARSSSRLADGAGRAGRRFRGLARDARDARTEIGRLGGAGGGRLGLGGAGGGLGGLGGLAGLGSAYAAARQFRRAFELEDARIFARGVIQAPAGQDPDAALERAVQRARTYARTSLATERELLTSFYEASSAGFQSPVASDVSEIAHRVARVTRGEIGQVTAVLSRTLNQFGDRFAGATVTDRATLIGDVLKNLQASEQISDFGALGESIKEGTKGILQSGADPIQSLAVLAKLNSLGAEGSSAGTLFTALVRELPRASEKLNFELAQTEDGALDVIATLRNLEAVLDGLDRKGRALKIAEGLSGEAAAGVALLKPALDDIDALTESAARGGSVMEDYGRFLEGAGGKARVAGQGFQQAGDAITTGLLDPLGQALGPLGALAERLGIIIERSPVVQDAILGTAVAVAGLGAAAIGVKLSAGLAALLGLPALGVAALGVGAYAATAPTRRAFHAGLAGREADAQGQADALERAAAEYRAPDGGQRFRIAEGGAPNVDQSLNFGPGSIILQTDAERAATVLLRRLEEERDRAQDRSHYDYRD